MDETVMFGFMKFRDFFMCEAFEPRAVEFGTDTKDGKWQELNDHFQVTYFRVHNETYVVIYREGYLGFALVYPPKEIDVTNIKTSQELFRQFSIKPRTVGAALPIFNMIIYVLLDALRRFSPEDISFTGYTPEHKRLYGKLVKDKSFLKIVNDAGYVYNMEINGEHWFTKK